MTPPASPFHHHLRVHRQKHGHLSAGVGSDPGT